MTSTPPSPPLPGSSPDTPGISSLPSFKCAPRESSLPHTWLTSRTKRLGYFSAPFEKFARDENFLDWQSAFTLVGACRVLRLYGARAQPAPNTDTIETFFDARVDLFVRVSSDS